MKPSHRLGECPHGVEWCDPQNHMCEECSAAMTDYVYERHKDELMREEEKP